MDYAVSLLEVTIVLADWYVPLLSLTCCTNGSDMIATIVRNRTVMCPLLLSCVTHLVNVHTQHTIQLYNVLYVPISTPMYNVTHAYNRHVHTCTRCPVYEHCCYISSLALQSQSLSKFPH